MYRNVLILLLFIFCLGCVSNNHKNYFEFDEIEYYRLDPNYVGISENITVFEEKDSAKLENFEYSIIHGYKPDGIKNDGFQEKLLKVGYVRRGLDSKFYKEINTIFSAKEAVDLYAMACVPWFRDILIFKYEGNVTGIAKICFQCRQSHIRGTKENVYDFGQDGDFEKLEEIMYNEN